MGGGEGKLDKEIVSIGRVQIIGEVECLTLILQLHHDHCLNHSYIYTIIVVIIDPLIYSVNFIKQNKARNLKLSLSHKLNFQISLYLYL